jgi:hypothetical protein
VSEPALKFSSIAVAAVPFLVAVFSSWLSGYFFARKKGREDFIDKRCDELSDLAWKTTEKATIYWSRAASPDASEQTETAKIQSAFVLIGSLRAILETQMSEAAAEALADGEQRLFRLCTSGDFGASDREADIGRASKISVEGATFVSAIREQRAKDLAGTFRRN